MITKRQYELMEIAKNVCNELKIPISKNIIKEIGEINGINTRGFCKQIGDDYKISVSKFSDEFSEHIQTGTFIHELLHTINGCMNHGSLWQLYANKVSTRTKYKIKTTWDKEELTVEQNHKLYKYILKCTFCGEETYYSNNCKSLRNPEQLRCYKCKNKTIVRIK